MSKSNANFLSRTESIEKNRRYIQSVSDIYGRDEVEELLDEIRHLEPCSLQTDDIQDFEIDGSRHLQNNGESTISVSVQSWDSHAVYRAQMENCHSPVEIFQAIIVHCYIPQCLETLELFRLAFLACCIGSLSFVFLSEWMYLSSPLVFIVVFSALCTCWLLIADITGVIYFLPISWPKFNTLLFLCIAFALLIISALLIHSVRLPSFFEQSVNETSLHFLYIAGIFSLIGSFLAFIQSLWTSCGRPYPAFFSAANNLDLPSPGTPPASTPGSPSSRPAMVTMAALAGMSSAAIATAPRLGNTNRNRNTFYSKEYGREHVPLRPIVRNSVSWDDVKPSSARLKQQNQLPSLLNET